jgi:long-chain acyl-CoA synthetase
MTLFWPHLSSTSYTAAGREYSRPDFSTTAARLGEAAALVLYNGRRHREFLEGCMIETLSGVVLHILKEYAAKPDILQYRADGRYVPISTAEFGRRIRALALGLRELGCGPGRKLAILSENRPEWILTDLANLCLGGITVPIYPTTVPPQIKYILEDSESTAVVCSTPALRDKVEAIRSDLPSLRQALVMDGPAGSGFRSLDEIVQRGEVLDREQPELFDALASAVRKGDLASIIYTSGTTGVPKGVMLSHGNFTSNIEAMDRVTDFNRTDTILSFLPLSHVLERMTTFAFLYKGASIAYAESIDRVADNLLEVRPTIMVSVPRLFEKIYAKVMDNVLAGSALKKKIFFWAVKTGLDQSRRAVAGRKIPAGLAFRRRLAHKLVFLKILEKTGGRVKFMVSGGAPLSRDIAEFFYALGLIILEGYGLTETAPVVSCNTFDRIRFGTVGPVVPGVEVCIGADGEILVKGPNVMQGYYKKPAETAEVIVDGWFHTGDIGFLDADGFLTITDRKKDLIVTAGGKNVAPQPIENVLKRIPAVANVVVVGGRRKFISALIVPERDKLIKLAKDKGLSFSSYEALLAGPEIRAALLEAIDAATPDLASYEKIKKIILLERDFEVDREELTPTLKIKRAAVEARYKDLIDALYRD